MAAIIVSVPHIQQTIIWVKINMLFKTVCKELIRVRLGTSINVSCSSYNCNSCIYNVFLSHTQTKARLSVLSACFPVLRPTCRPNPTCFSFSASWALRRSVSARALSRHNSLFEMVACSSVTLASSLHSAVS